MSAPNYKWQQWLSLGLPFPLIFLNGWLALQVLQYFQPLVTILILTALLALILSYPVQFLHRNGVGRNLAVFLVFLLALTALVAFGITLVPILLKEFSEIARLLPDWISSSKQQLQGINNWVERQNLPTALSLHKEVAGGSFGEPLSQLTAQIAERLPGEIQAFAEQTFSIVLEAIDSISEVILIVVLTFYLLLDGERLWRGLFRRLPFSSQIEESLLESFQNYFIGQVTLASLVGLAMTLIFLVLRVPFGLLFGIGIGFLSLVPFGDVLGFSLVSLLVAYQDFWLGVKTLVLVILVDQVIDQVIAPRILGGFTGLRPVWVLISLLVGTKIAGLLGLLIAVPMASFIKSTIDSVQASTTNTSNIELARKQ
ncbi:MAG: AI-2E family transporter [Chroococcidiopsidaceae cyanobacterium CP_BM_RX_35]|nr:AI-2E family transporter [Chroococcidiopsidaceae cyanobacterium CP_BM_RX_35]